MTDPLAVTKFLGNPEELAVHIRKTRDIESGFDYINLVYSMAQRLDSTLDIILPVMEEVYPTVKDADYKDMSFEDACYKKTLLSTETIMRHTRFGRELPKIPEKFRDAVANKGVKEKNRLISVLEEDYEINDRQWDKIASAMTYQDVSEVVHEIKGTEPRKQWCRFYFDDLGSVWARTHEGTFKILHKVDVDNDEVQKIIEWALLKAHRKLEATRKPKERYT